MNRRKKVKDTLKKKAKKKNLKLNPKNKSKYIAKADREAVEQNNDTAN